jgi:hypothetical protein
LSTWLQSRFVRKTVGLEQKLASRVGTYFFRKWGRGGRGPGASPGVPNPPPGPPRRLAARGGKGGLCTALSPGVGVGWFLGCCEGLTSAMTNPMSNIVFAMAAATLSNGNTWDVISNAPAQR